MRCGILSLIFLCSTLLLSVGAHAGFYPGDSTDYSAVEPSFSAGLDSSLADILGEPQAAQDLDSLTKAPETWNKVSLLHLGMHSFPQRLKLIQEAKKYIFISMPYWDQDSEGRHLIDAINQRKQTLAAQGQELDVRLLHDWTTGAAAKDYDGSSFMPLLEAMTDNKSLSWNPLWNFRSWSFNIPKHRLHEKIFVVDGNKLMMGGINFANAYLLGGISEQGWHDTDILIEGPAAQKAARYVLKPWLFQRYLEQNYSPLPTSSADFHKIMNDFYYHDKSEFDFSGLYYPEGQENATPEWQKFHLDFGLKDFLNDPNYFYPIPKSPDMNTPVRLIYDSPLVDIDPKTGDSYSKIARTISYVASKAKHSIRVYCPYATFTDDFLKILTDAAERGIKVQIITNSEDSIDVFKALAVAVLPNYDKLLKAGAEIYEWQGHTKLKALYEKSGCKEPKYWPGGTLHTKAFVVDDSVVFMGSSNFNFRSELLNSEIMAFVRSPRLARQLVDIFSGDLEDTALPAEKRTLECGDGRILANRPARLERVQPARVEKDLEAHKFEAKILRYFRFIL